ncbi:MAG: UvrD-helicase domain-containing protein [Planctomycetota bacterium]
MSPVCTPESLKHTFLLASAGSGKTWQLTSRYLQLVAAGARPASILASTFTRAAAGEIRDRILVRLARAASDEKGRAELAGAIGAPALTRAQALDLLAEVAGALHHMQIRTLDSFFASVATAFAVELGLPYGFGIAEDDEAVRMRTDAIRATLATGRTETWIDLLRQLTQGATQRAVTRTIDETVKGLLELHAEADDNAWECIPKVRGRLGDEALDAAVDALAAVPVPDTKKMVHKAWRKSIDQARDRNWDDFLDGGPPAKLAAGVTKFGKSDLDPQLVEAYEPIMRHVRAVLVHRAREQTLATRDLLGSFRQHYDEVKRRRRALTFDDLNQAMKRAETHGRLDEICFRIDATLRHLLLDEFQDTSLPQWRALEPMAREIVSNVAGEYTLFCVGDVKQSLYGWRDAAPEVLDELPDLLRDPDGKSALEPETLAKSWRSSPVIIDVVNAVFENLDGNDVLDDHRDAADLWSAGFTHHETEKTDLPGYARLQTVRRAGESEKQDVVRLQAAADLVQELLDRHPRVEIGVLTRTNKAVARLLYELGPSRRGLRASGRGGGALTDAPAVNAVCDLLRLADHPEDTVAAFNVAGGPLGEVVGLTDHASAARCRRVARRVRKQLLTDGYADTISGWATRLLPSVDRREGRRLLDLVELAGSYDARATLRPSAFVESVEQTSVAVTRAAPVQVMTVHKSKGLEFDVVILADLESALTGGGRPTVVYERDGETGPITRICRFMNDVTRGFVPDLQPLFDRETRRTVRESLCTLYVAMTRARQGLYMLVDPPAANEKTIRKKASSILRRALAVEPVEPQRVLYEHGDESWIDSAPAGTDTPPPETPGEIRLKPSSRPSYGASVSPSRLAAAQREQSPADRLGLADGKARDRGTAVHAMFERIEWLEDGTPDESELADVAARSSPRRGAAWARDQAERFLKMLGHDAVRHALSIGGRDRSTLCVWREQPFARLVDGAVQEGAIDRLEAELGGDGSVRRAVVIDFKTDDISAADAEKTAEIYRLQLKAYREAAAQFLGIDAAAVETMVLFVTPGVAVKF